MSQDCFLLALSASLDPGAHLAHNQHVLDYHTMHKHHCKLVAEDLYTPLISVLQHWIVPVSGYTKISLPDIDQWHI